MKNKKKQSVAVAMATALGVTSIISPVSVYAQDDHTSQEITKDETTEISKEQSPPQPEEVEKEITKQEEPVEEPSKEQKPVEASVVKPALLSKNSAAQPTSTDVKIDDTNFPDANFRQYVQTNFDLDDNQSLSQDEINKIQSIYISKDANLKSLKGIELFPELLELTCSYTGITELDVTKNAKLTKLNCENTQISSLDVRNNPALDTIFCQYTKITELDVTQNGNLRILDCSSLNMTSLDVSQNSHLLELHINNTNLSWMNLGDHPNLHVLHQRVDQMKHVRNDLTQSFYIQDVVEGIDISKVEVLYNGMYSPKTGRVTVYNLDKPIKYQYLCGRVGNSNFYIYVTMETMIDINEVNFPDDAFRQYILDECDTSVKDGKLSPIEIQNVKVIDIKGKTEIKDLTGIEKFVNLESLYCSNTGLTSLDVSKNTNLRVLAYTDTELQWLDVGTNPYLDIIGWAHRTIHYGNMSDTFNLQDVIPGINLKKVTITSNGTLDQNTGTVTVTDPNQPVVYSYYCGEVKGNPFTLTGTISLTIEIDKKNFPDDTFRKYIIDTYDKNPTDGKLSTEEINTIKSIDVSGKTDIKDLTGLERFVNLEELNCANSGITSLRLSKNTKLRSLNCTDTELYWMDIAINKNLTTVKLPTPTIYRNDKNATFTLQDVLKGINLKKVTITSNGTLNSDTGTIKVTDPYQSVAYSYQCGEANGKAIILNGTIEPDFKVNIDTAHFPDDIFRNYIFNTFDTSKPKDAVLTTAEIKAIKSIDISKQKIKDLTGVEHFKSLEVLDCSNTSITSLDVSYNKKLRLLNCKDTELYWLDIGINQNLTTIELPTPTIYRKDMDVSFKLQDVVNGINLKKVSIKSNGTFDDVTGEIKVTDLYQPVVYSYQCGEANGKPIILNGKIEATMLLDKTNIPDDEFRQYILDSYSENPKEKRISLPKILSITEIKIAAKRGIKDLKGIEMFVNLEVLECENTGITSLDISNNKALKYLKCSNTGIKSLDVSNHVNLESLYCNNTGLTSLDISNNKDLMYLSCNNTRITSLNVENQNKLNILSCSNTGLTSLDVTMNPLLTFLDCNTTGITTLDVSKNTKLEVLHCYNTGLTSLNLKNNRNIISLQCAGTDITTLDVSNQPYLSNLVISYSKISDIDVSKNTILKTFECSYTNLSSLDIRNNRMLQLLNCENTPLAWLKIDNPELFAFHISSPTININVNDDTFNITKQFEGIDPSKVTIISNGTIDPKTGIVSGYQMGTPIQYSYDCGTSKQGSETLDVTLILEKSDRTISFVDTLDQTYTGKPINDPKVTFTGSGTAEYSYEAWNGKAWENLSTNPVNVGKYRVTAYVPADEYNNEVSIAEEFDITQATNTWIKKPDIQDWTYKGTVPQPTGEAAFGMKGISFTYSSSEQGPFDSKVPEAVGIWYMKASIGGTENYTGLEEIVAFEIKKAKAPAIQIPDNLSGVHDETLSTIPLPKGWNWVDGNQILDVDTIGYIAQLDVDDQNYDYRNVEGYDGHGHVVRALQVSVDPATNIWIETPTIKDWTYGETASSPSASAKYGNDLIKYTYSKSLSGPFTNDVPENAGIWYMKATIEGTKHYEKLESTIISFEIQKAKAPAISIPSNLNGVKGNLLSTIQLPKDWSWTNPNETLDQNKADYLARLHVDGLNYDYSQVNGYDSAGSYVELALPVVVSSATNSWTVGPSIKGWVYGETKNQPVATPKYGKVTITYSQSPMDGFTTDQPENAGRWYMKASVAATKDYTGLEEIIGFEIKQAAPQPILQPDQLSGVYDDKLSSVVLENGWYWVDGNQILDTDTTGYLARLDVDDQNYDYSKVEGYNAKEHCIERALMVAVSPTTNAWIQAPSISDWTYGKQASTPTGKAQYGDIRFTYSDAETGTFTDQVPRDAGTWYMKASVTDTKEYTGLTSIQKFTIAPMNIEDNEDITISDIKKEEDVKHLVVKDGDEELVKDKDYEVTETQRGHMGIVTIRFKGNYAGTIIKSYPKTIVATGDSTNTGLLATMSLLSAGCLAWLTGKNRRNKRKQRG